MKRRAAAVLACLASLAAAAQDPAPPKKASACVPCHGAKGLSQAPDAPNLAGQPAIYLMAQLRAFRDRSRRHETMNVMAATLTDADIEALAAWFAAVPIEIREPR